LSHELARAVASFAAHLRHARAGRPASVHAARVASRRLRELLPVLALAYRRFAAEARDLRRRVRRLARALGRVRELDVTIELAARHPTTKDWPAAVRARVARALALERTSRHDVMVARLDAIDLPGLTRSLRAFARRLRLRPPHALPAAVTRRRRRRARTLAAAIARAGTLYAPGELHAVRIAAKKLRYLLEWTQEPSKGRSPLAAELRAAQRLLGDLNDRRVLETWIRRLAAETRLDAATDRALTASAVALEADCRARHGQFVAVMPALSALAKDLSRPAPVAWIRRRPARMTAVGRRAEAAGARAARERRRQGP
jgi:CHAD domain-containing protein